MPPKEFQPDSLQNFQPRYSAEIVPNDTDRLDQIFETPYGEIFDYSLQCLSVRDPESDDSVTVSKDPFKDSNRPLDWKVKMYDAKTGEVIELIVQNVSTIPEGDIDLINLDLVGAHSPRFIDSRLSFALRKVDYKRDKSQPVTLTAIEPYGVKDTIVNRYTVDTELGDRVSSKKPIKVPIARDLGHLAADLAA